MSFWPSRGTMLILMAGSSGAANGPTLAGSRSGVWAAEVDQVASEYPATGVLARGAAVSPRAPRSGAADGGCSWQESGLVFTTSVGTVVEPRNLSRTFEHLVQRSGVRRIRFHDLRHTCASLLLAQGVSPRVVMDVLGHSQLSITMDLYSHVMPSAFARCRRRDGSGAEGRSITGSQ